MKRYKGNLMHVIKWKKRIWRGSVLCDSSCTTSEKGKITETARKSVVSRVLGGAGMNQQSTNDFYGITLSDRYYMIPY